MKLRTRLREDGDRKMYAAVKIGRTSEDIEHDALAAHALRQAVYEICGFNLFQQIDRKAAGILAGWTGKPTDRRTPEGE